MIREMIANKLDVPVGEISRESEFRDLGADSLDTVELMMEVENLFGVKISDEEMQSIRNVGDVEDIIKLKTDERNS